MFFQDTIEDDLLKLPALGGFRWGFTTRNGGFSQPPYHSLNLADHVGDDLAVVARNRLLLQEKVGGGESLWVSARQVHGTAVWPLPPPGTPLPAVAPEADIIVSQYPGYFLAILVADCVPVILLEPESGIYAVAHCGWRGTAAHGAAMAVQAMVHLGAQSRNIRAAVGPSIGPCCFSTKSDVYDCIRAAFPTGAAAAFGENIDLKALCVFDLRQAGVPAENICCSKLCSRCHADFLYSYRNNNVTGRFAGYVTLPTS